MKNATGSSDCSVLVTGGGGFIGSHLVESFVADGMDVRVLDDFSSGREENLAQWQDAITLFRGDLCDKGLLKEAFSGVRYVFHKAALPSVPRSIENPAETHRVCVTGTLSILEAARDAGVERVIYAGSSSAYGNQKAPEKTESLLPSPLSPYAAGKLCGEYYCRVFSEVYGLDTVTLRYFNVFGPRQDPNSPYSAVIPIFISRMQAGKPPIIYGDGEHTRDFTFVANVVQANRLACTASGPLSGNIYNAACGEKISLNQLVAMLNELLGTDLAPVYEPPRAGDVKHSLADISQATEDLGYQPLVHFREGLKQTIAWYLKGEQST